MRICPRLWLVWLAAFSILSGCTLHSPTADKARKQTATTQSRPQAKPVATLDQRIARLLSDAEYALSQNQLLTPIEDNAFDRYQSVLLLDPNNAAARAGLQAIGLRYVELARAAIGRGQFSQAQSYINNARSIDRGSPLIHELETSLRRARAAQPAPQPYQPGPNEHLLDAAELTRKSPQLLAQLERLAHKAQASGDLVIIHARTDAEGRWIYAQMREALQDFLLRGDIKIASQPRIQFVPPL